jgi:hypothetical protein
VAWNGYSTVQTLHSSHHNSRIGCSALLKIQ